VCFAVLDHFAAFAHETIGSLTTTLGPFQEVVQSLGPAFVKVAVALNPVINAFTTFIGRTVSALAPVLGDIVTAFASLLPGALKIVVPILNFVASAIERLSGFFTGMSPGLKSFLIAMGGIALVVMKLGGPMLILVRVATFAFNIFSKLVKIFSVVRYVIALMGGPVTIIIAAIMALGAGLVWLYKNNETFRNVVQSVWKKVQEVIAVVVNWFQTTAWPVMQRIFSELGKIAMWLWQNAIKPAWEGMQIAFEVLGRIFSWVWNNVLKPAFMAWTRYMGFLWNYVLKPFFGYLKFEFNVVATLINWWWNIMIKPPLKAFGAILLWLWNNVAKPTWNNMKIGFGILANWLVSKYQKNVKPMIDNFKRGLYVLRDVFTSVRDSIRSRWEKLVGYVSGPLERVRGIINNNFIKPVNSLLKQLGAKQIPYIGVGGGGRTSPSRSQAGGTQKYETGGPVAGSSPSPTADNINAWLTAKEWVIRQKSSINMMRNYPGYLEHINRHGRPPGFATGGPVGDGHGAPAQSMPRYALGGVVDSIKQFAKSPAKYLRDFGDKIAGVASSGTNFVGDIGAKVIRRIAEAVIGRAKKAIEKAASVAGGAVGAPSVKGVMGWQKQWNWLKAAYPSAVLTSSYRPGAITASGNASYHSMGRAIDVTPSMAIFNLIKKAFGSSIKELIYSPAGGAQVKNGRNYYYTGAVRAMHFNHVHWAMANGGMVPSNPYVADMGAMLAPGVNVLHNKLGKPEPLVRADLLDTRLAGLATTIAENTDMLTRINGGSTGASNRVSQPLSGSGMAAVLTEALRQGLSAEALSKLIVEGRFTIDEHGVAYFRGIATDVVQENNDLANHLGRNRR
jgi:phage-related protein